MKKIRKYYYAGNIVYPGLNTLDRSNNWMDVMAQQVMPTPQISSVLFPPQSWMSPIQKALANNYILNLGVTSKNNGISSIPATSSTEDIQDNNIGSALGNIFSQGVSSIGNTAFNNIMKGLFLSDGMALDAASSIAGAAAGLTGNLIGQGINSLGGNSMLSRGIGQGIATGIGTIGGQALSNIVNGKAAFGGISDSIKAIKGIKNASNISKAAGISNLAGIGGQIVGAGLQAAFGPSKEYEGRYGGITKGMDTAYDLVQGAAGFIPGVGTAISGAMALNKGLSNIFGSTSGMTKQDAILGSAFMPAPVKWLNMAGAKTTLNFNNQSWQNTERTNAFMQNAFGNLSDRFDRAREEAGKTYGTFSSGARKSADRNLAFANNAWEQILAMADLDELQRIRSQYMTSINNLRYAQMILGGWNPIYRGKQGMKIFNNATNHNLGMRLLSGAALIDNKQMILSAQSGTKFIKPIIVTGYPLVEAKSEGLLDYFNNNPNVGGMAIGAGLNGINGERRVVLNPNLKDDNSRNSVYMNESYRHYFDENNTKLPIITNIQRNAYKGTPYENLDTLILRTEVARYLSGDPSHHLNDSQKAQLYNRFKFVYPKDYGRNKATYVSTKQ